MNEDRWKEFCFKREMPADAQPPKYSKVFGLKDDTIKFNSKPLKAPAFLPPIHNQQNIYVRSSPFSNV